jgi:hypothetical protein
VVAATGKVLQLRTVEQHTLVVEEEEMAILDQQEKAELVVLVVLA